MAKDFDPELISSIAGASGSLFDGIGTLIGASQGKAIAQINADATVGAAQAAAEGNVGVAKYTAEGNVGVAQFMSRALQSNGIALSEERQKMLKYVSIGAVVLVLVLILKK